MSSPNDCSHVFKGPLKVLELYSGIGGMHFAIKNLPIESYELIAIDINTSANSVYKYNHLSDNCCQQLERNILSLSDKHFNDWSIDLMTMSPPCQPFTRLGLKRDLDDKRADSFTHLMHILPKVQKLPKYILVENVKGFETSEARQLLIQTLITCGYGYQELLLSPKQFNVPNARLRYYLMAKHKQTFHFNPRNDEFVTKPPEIDSKTLCPFCAKYLFPENYLNDLKPIDHYLEQLDDKQMPMYLLSDKILANYFMILDIVKSDSLNTNCFTKSYSHRIEGTGSVLQTTDYDIQDICRQLDASQTDDQKLSILRSIKLRFFTPKEIANLMSFPSHFDFPDHFTAKQKYRLLGNSVNVKVIEYLLKLVLNDCGFKALNN